MQESAVARKTAPYKSKETISASAAKRGRPKKTAPYKSKETILAGAAKHGYTE
ncbi:MAG: hypothetical protein RSA97_08380 [Oscillospiraceae bacterium]